MTKFDNDFLDCDHEISLDALISIINSEISWCHRYSVDELLVSKDFRVGFIAGLEQAKHLIIRFAKLEDEEE